MNGRFVVQRNGRSIVPLRNGEFEWAMTAPGEFYISGRAVDALAAYEKYPKPGETGSIIAPDSGVIENVRVKSLTFDESGIKMRVRNYFDADWSGSHEWELECIPGVTWFWDYASAAEYISSKYST